MYEDETTAFVYEWMDQLKSGGAVSIKIDPSVHANDIKDFRQSLDRIFQGYGLEVGTTAMCRNDDGSLQITLEKREEDDE